MKHLIILGALLFNAFFVFSQKPTNAELHKTTANIQNLIQRDSLNNLIISELESRLDSIQLGLSGKSQPATVMQETIKHEIEESAKPAAGDSQSIWAFMLIAFGGGLIALLTPCVFPMIPLTVTFFTANSTNKSQAIRKALVYGFSIVLIYSIIGVFISATLGPSFATFMSVHWVPNLIFFIIFITFGLSFLGLFEITLPNSFVNRVDAQSEKGGYYGVFFMAFTLVLVSFSCTGPIVGSILVQAFQGEAIRPIMGMIAYATAFAIPFTIFAMFPQLLSHLPKSGGWLNVIKATLGFLELGLALKFLSMIDQVYHLNLLDREVYIAIWIAISFILGYYLLGKFRLPHDTEIKVVSVPRLVMALAPIAFAIYMLPGMFGAPLKALSGYLPPMHTHDFDLPAIIRQQGITVNPKESETSGITLCDEPKYKGKFNLPHGLKGYFDYKQALACAKEKNLPLFIDFTGHGCVNCREVEANVWSDQQVLNKLKRDFVIVSLYVDDFTKLMPEEVYYSEDSKIDIETIGERNFDLEQKMFGVTSQPYYVILDPHTEKPLTEPVGYVSSATIYLQFLEAGLEKFGKKK